MKTNWMKTLSQQYQRACDEFPDKQLMILFDIDGSILDMRHMVLMVLQAYDHDHDTNYFERLRLSQITVHENQVDDLLEELKIPKKARRDILDWYKQQRWTTAAIREMHHPFEGVLDVIRWFQLQPNTDVGLVTGRPESLREDTLESLNQFGKPYRVIFTNELLFMNLGNWEEQVPDIKVAGLKYFTDAGYHVFAFVDNEPLNLKALDKADLEEQVLLLHANTIFESIRTRVPRGTARGKDYRLSKLVPNEKVLPS
ncbi:MAG: HAD hydrolase-like protein, partial [Chloroflexi bacterium]|nr:HAD hydrolase-like protein [Chloroflexota bacterium]